MDIPQPTISKVKLRIDNLYGGHNMPEANLAGRLTVSAASCNDVLTLQDARTRGLESFKIARGFIDNEAEIGSLTAIGFLSIEGVQNV